MSTANKANDTYLQHVSLKNYKSIKDVEIDFRPGLNIIIGKNASGKTNFVNGINSVLSLNFDDLLDSEFVVEALSTGSKIEVHKLQSAPETFENEIFDLPIDHNVSLKIDN